MTNNAPTRNKSSLSRWILPGLLFSLIITLYSGSLSGGFKWDDHDLIVDNRGIRSWHDPQRDFTRPLKKFPTYYRPLQTTSYRLDYMLWQLEPAGYHLTNILLHAINAFLVYILFLLLTKGRNIAFIAALLFSCHPALAEPVNYISSRSDLLVACFTFSSFIFYLLFGKHDKKIFFGFSLLSFCLAMLSKETAILLPFFLLLYEWTFHRSYRTLMPYFVTLAAFLVFRQIIVPFKAYSHVSLLAMFSIPKAITGYSLAMIFPRDLFKTWSIPPAAPGATPGFLLPFLVPLLFVIALKKTYHRSKFVFFGISWFLLGLLPFLVLFSFLSTHRGFPFSFAWLYTPSIGVFLAISSIIEVQKKKKGLVWLLVFMAISAFSLATLGYNRVWASSEIDFYKYVLKNKPDIASILLTNMGRVYLVEGDDKKAFELFNEALRIDPNDSVAIFNIGAIYLKNNDTEKAIQEFKKAVLANPSNADAHYNLAILYARRNDPVNALKEYDIVVRLEPDAFLKGD